MSLEQFMVPLTWEWIPIIAITILLILVKGEQGFGGNIIGSFIIAIIGYLIVKIPILFALGGTIPNTNPQHHLFAAIISAIVCGCIGGFAVARSHNPNLPPLHKFFFKK